MSPGVSILLSSYNHAAFVAEAVESVLAQDFESFELIVRDDGSTDGTETVLDRYEDPRIVRVDSTRHLGGAGSLNFCLKHARGEHVAIMNSDDVWLPERLSTQLAIMKSQPGLGAVFSHADIIDARGKPVQAQDHFYGSVFQQQNRAPHEWLRYFFLKGNGLCHPSALIRRTVYEEIGSYDPLMDQLPDFDLWVRLCARYPIHVHQAPLLKFRVLDQEANASGDSVSNRDRTAYELVKVLGRFAEAPILQHLHEIFPEWVKPDDGRSKRLRGLVNAALAVLSSPHHFFALDCLRDLAGAGDEEVQKDWDHLRKLGRSARPFSIVYGRPVKCRIKVRRGEEKFTAQQATTRGLDSGVVTSGFVELPAATEQVRLEMEGGYTSLQVMGLSLSDANGTMIWDGMESSMTPMKVSGVQLLTGSDEKLRYASTGGVTKLTLPAVAMGDGGTLSYMLRVDHDHAELLRSNEILSRRIKELEAMGGGEKQPSSWLERFWPKRLA